MCDPETIKNKVQFPAKQQVNVGGQAAPPVLTQCPSSVASTSFPSLIFPDTWLTLSLLPRNGCRDGIGGEGVAGVAGRRKEAGEETGRWGEQGARTHTTL